MSHFEQEVDHLRQRLLTAIQALDQLSIIQSKLAVAIGALENISDSVPEQRDFIIRALEEIKS